MSFYQAFKMAWESILGNKMRTFLTMLGMIIGVASVIALVSLMQGMISFSKEQYKDMGSDQLTVTLTAKSDKKPMKEEEMYEFVEDNTELYNQITPQITSTLLLRRGDHKLENRTVTGVNESYLDIAKLKLEEGRFLTYGDMETRKKVCVIGSYTNQKLFPDVDPIGQNIRVGNDTFEVIGVLKEKADSTEGSSDDCIYVPYTTLSKVSFQGRIMTYVITGKDDNRMKEAKKVLEQFLYDRYHTDEAYSVFSLTELLDMMDQMTGMMQNILVGIAGISLLVAGIGIMNIMLVSVTERTKEIGIRKSLGARRRDIMRQFVLEAGMVSTIGGILGIILGGTATTMLGNMINLKASPSIGAIILASGVSAGIGIIFGYLPANKAAKLNPIDALRNE